jgi:excisionase family DNA binding protein
MNYLSIEQLSNRIQLSKSTIYKLCMRRCIPYMKAGKRLLFREDAIDKWLEQFQEPTMDVIQTQSSKLLKNKKND